jgi:hypothetical protein
VKIFVARDEPFSIVPCRFLFVLLYLMLLIPHRLLVHPAGIVLRAQFFFASASASGGWGARFAARTPVVALIFYWARFAGLRALPHAVLLLLPIEVRTVRQSSDARLPPSA